MKLLMKLCQGYIDTIQMHLHDTTTITAKLFPHIKYDIAFTC